MDTWNTDEILTFLNSHGSVRRYTDDPVTDEQIERIISAAQRAPTSSNLQAYSILVVRNQETKSRLAQLAGDQQHVRECAALFVFCPDLYRLRRICEETGYNFRHEYFEYSLLAIVDAALAGQNALLALEAMGLGGCMIGGLRTRAEEVAETLKLPPLVFALFGLTVGVPARKRKVKERLAPAVIRHDEQYDAEQSLTGLQEYDQLLREKGVYKGRRVPLDNVGPDPTDSVSDEDYGWLEHTARRLATPRFARPDLRPFLSSRKFGFL